MMLGNHSRFAVINAALVALGLSAAPVATAIAHASTIAVADSSPASPLLAQVDSCRQVTNRISGLNVRQAPTLTANVIGVVPGGDNVTLQNRGQSGWVPITEPFDGYVSASYLIYCNPAVRGTVSDTPVANAPVTDASEVCRQVIVRSGLNVRAEPTVYSTRVGILRTGTNVTVVGSEVNNWLPISEPINGYVAARFLGDC